MSFTYDVALSFAGEQRSDVEQVATCLKAAGLKVFYDEYQKADLWGKNLYDHLSDIYQNQAHYCIIFCSKEYAEKQWTNHERESAQARAFTEKGDEYILPVRFDDTKIRGILPTIGYLNFGQEGADGICRAFLQKISKKVTQDNPNLRPEGVAVPDTRPSIVPELSGKPRTDHHVRPDVTLMCIPIADRKISRSVTWQTGGKPDAYNFRVTNKGPGQIVNVSIEPLILPMSAETIAQHAEVERAFSGTAAPDNAPPNVASNQWTVIFEEIGSIPAGEEAIIPFEIENTGALQRTDLHHCLSRTGRAENFAPLLLPLDLRFSNLDGATWLQTYELSHDLVGNIKLAFRRVSRHA